MKKTSIALSNHSALSSIRNWMNDTNSTFTSLLEVKVSNSQVLALAHACVAFTTLMISASFSPLAALASLAWFVASLQICKRGGLK